MRNYKFKDYHLSKFQTLGNSDTCNQVKSCTKDGRHDQSQRELTVAVYVKQLFTKYQFFTKMAQISHSHKNLNFKSIIGPFKTNCLYSMYFTREGQKVLATIFFLFTWVHLYKGGSVYIKYEPLSFMPCNMDSVARLVALRH